MQPTEKLNGTLTIDIRGKKYLVTEFKPDFGERAFYLLNLKNGNRYGVLLDKDTRKVLCECRSFERWNTCRHVVALMEMFIFGEHDARVGTEAPVQPLSEP